ncbi:hypothetical protein LTR97_003783 [Elasticomyces elasticus]|uniref:Uncharacterized protein n=1 Tax=Elasticomyces elasticus TaxID=574655 RepID=A0AAN7W862_9PEZI|nr:hypothetical protein LTR97_003783 [Elasticomyces elasticus]
MVPGTWGSKQRGLENMVADAALRIVAPRHGVLTIPTVTTASKNRYQVDITYFDAQVLNQMHTSGTVSASALPQFLKSKKIEWKSSTIPARPVPALPALFVRPILPPETNTDALKRRSAEAMAWVVAQVHGSVATDATLTLRVQACKELLGMSDGEDRVDDSMYRQEAIFVTSATDKGFDLDPSSAVHGDTFGTRLNTIKVPANPDAVSRVIEAGERHFLQNGDVVLAWRCACQRADFEQHLALEGLDAESCHCQPSQKHSKSHLCKMCKSLTICDWLTNGICPHCQTSGPCRTCSTSDEECDQKLPRCSGCEQKDVDCVYDARLGRDKRVRTCLRCAQSDFSCDKAKPACTRCVQDEEECIYFSTKKHPCCNQCRDNPNACDRVRPSCSECTKHSRECSFEASCKQCTKAGEQCSRELPSCAQCTSKHITCSFGGAKSPCNPCIKAGKADDCGRERPACSNCVTNDQDCSYTRPKTPCALCILTEKSDRCGRERPICSQCAEEGKDCSYEIIRQGATPCLPCSREGKAGECGCQRPICSQCVNKGGNCSFPKNQKIPCDACKQVGKANDCGRERPMCSQCANEDKECFYTRDRRRRACESCIEAGKSEECGRQTPTCSQCTEVGDMCIYKASKACVNCVEAGEDCGREETGCHQCVNHGRKCSFKESGEFMRLWNLYRVLINHDVAALEKIGSRKARELATTLLANRSALKKELATRRRGQDLQDEYLLCPMDSKRSGLKQDGFAPSPDAMYPVTVTGEGGQKRPALHVLQNIRFCHLFLNRLKGNFSHLLLRCYSDLCKSHSEDELREILRQLDHIYLIGLQVPHQTDARLQLAVSKVESFMAQSSAGIASPEGVASIGDPWKFYGSGRHRFSQDREETAKPDTLPADQDPFPNFSRLKEKIAEIEATYDVKFGEVPYLFNPANKPTVWRWSDVRAFYASHLFAMNNWCDEQHSNERSAGGLLVLHCLQYANPRQFAPAGFPDDFDWLRQNLEPYSRSPMGASAGHAVHGQEMKLGLDSDFNFNPADCTVDWESWPWNRMKGRHEIQLPRMITTLRETPKASPNHWPAERALVPNVPETTWQPEVSQRERFAALVKLLQPQPPATAHPPPAQNLSNTDNICYASSVLQALHLVPALKRLIVKSVSAPLRTQTGRPSQYLLEQRDDQNLSGHKRLLQRLRHASKVMAIAMTQLPPELATSILATVNTLGYDFPRGVEQDPGEFLDAMLEIMDTAGDCSRYNETGVTLQDNINDEHARAARELRIIAPLASDYRRAWDAHLQAGHDSPVTKLLGIQVAQESLCRSPGCVSRYARSFLHSNTINLVFPGDAVKHPDKAYSVEDLLQANDQIANDLEHDPMDCHFPDHAPKTEMFRRLLRLPPVLIMRVERQGSPGSLRGFKTQKEMEKAADRNRLRNRLIMEDTLDMSPWCDNSLPSESLDEFEPADRDTSDYPDRVLGDPCGPMKQYRLMGVISWRSYHIVTHARIKDEDGYMRWALLDDTRSEPTWENPLDNQKSSLETTLIYVKMSKSERSALRTAISGDTDMTDVEETELDEDEEDLNEEISARSLLEKLDTSDDDDEDDDEDDESDDGGEVEDWSKLTMAGLSDRLHKELSNMANNSSNDRLKQTTLMIASHVQRMGAQYTRLDAETGILRTRAKSLQQQLSAAEKEPSSASGTAAEQLETIKAELVTLEAQREERAAGLSEDNNALLEVRRSIREAQQQLENGQAAAGQARDETATATAILEQVQENILNAQRELDTLQAQAAQMPAVTQPGLGGSALAQTLALFPQLSSVEVSQLIQHASQHLTQVLQQQAATQPATPAGGHPPPPPPGGARPPLPPPADGQRPTSSPTRQTGDRAGTHAPNTPHRTNGFQRPTLASTARAAAQPYPTKKPPGR